MIEESADLMGPRIPYLGELIECGYLHRVLTRLVPDATDDQRGDDAGAQQHHQQFRLDTESPAPPPTDAGHWRRESAADSGERSGAIGAGARGA